MRSVFAIVALLIVGKITYLKRITMNNRDMIRHVQSEKGFQPELSRIGREAAPGMVLPLKSAASKSHENSDISMNGESSVADILATPGEYRNLPITFRWAMIRELTYGTWNTVDLEGRRVGSPSQIPETARVPWIGGYDFHRTYRFRAHNNNNYTQPETTCSSKRMKKFEKKFEKKKKKRKTASSL